MAGSGQDVNLRQSTFPPADEAVPPAQDGRTTTGQFAAGNLHGKATRFKPGVSGNPAGRRPAGLSIREWANLLTDAPIEQLKAIDANPEPEPWSKVIAARWLLRSGTNDLSKGGWPLADKPLAELFDRTTGRPAQQVEIKAEHRHLHLIQLTENAIAALDEAIALDAGTSATTTQALELAAALALPADSNAHEH